MSAFLVDKYTIDRIVSLIDRERRKSEYFGREVLAKELNVDLSDLDWRAKLGQKMWDLNQLALGYRYGDGKIDLKYLYSSVRSS